MGSAGGVIADVEMAKPTMARFAWVSSELPGAIKDILNELLDDPQHSDTTANFIASYHGAYESVFNFDTQDEYDAYIRGVELRTLSGVRVKSFEELEIANFLTKHGVRFCYERPYPKYGLKRKSTVSIIRTSFSLTMTSTSSTMRWTNGAARRVVGRGTKKG